MGRPNILIFVVPFALFCGCDKDSETHKASALERATAAQVRLRACQHANMLPLTISKSGSVASKLSADLYAPAIACVLEASDCSEVAACGASEQKGPPPDSLPNCDYDSPRANRCEGNVAKRCETDDDITFGEASYDCDLIGGICEDGVVDGVSWVECVVDAELCSDTISRCEGQRGIVCEQDEDRGITLAGQIDCADAFGSSCVGPNSQGKVYCEGEAVGWLGELQCDDGQDNDADGKPDCDDPDCAVDCASD